MRLKYISSPTVWTDVRRYSSLLLPRGERMATLRYVAERVCLLSHDRNEQGLGRMRLLDYTWLAGSSTTEVSTPRHELLARVTELKYMPRPYTDGE